MQADRQTERDLCNTTLAQLQAKLLALSADIQTLNADELEEDPFGNKLDVIAKYEEKRSKLEADQAEINANIRRWTARLEYVNGISPERMCPLMIRYHDRWVHLGHPGLRGCTCREVTNPKVETPKPSLTR